MARIIYTLLFLAPFLMAKVGPQMNDFLCGCEYCETVNPQEPLQLASHFIMCHSWREATLRTVELMRQTEKPKIESEDKNKLKEINKDEQNTDPEKDYKWRESDDYGKIYSTTNQINGVGDGWVYLDELSWVWLFERTHKFMYSENYGWIYHKKYKKQKILYWYDRRRWFLMKGFSDINPI